jgi:MarR family transcriptional regulator for hemolysin
MATDDGVNLIFLLCDTARLAKDRFNSRVKRLGLTRAQWQVLVSLRRFEGEHQASLAERLEVEPITLTRMLERMEKGGWITRKPDPKDKRVRCVYLTPKATPILHEVRQLAYGLVDDAMPGVTQEAQDSMEAALQTINRNLNSMPKKWGR